MSAHVVQCANFVAPGSGGLKTTLRHLGEGYAARGLRVTQVVPGRRDASVEKPWGRLVSVRAPSVPGTGYRVIAEPWRLGRLLDRLEPDRLEVHDRLTLRRLGRWATRRGVPSLVVSHERLDQVLQQWVPAHGAVARVVDLRAAADRSNRALAESFDRVVCTTDWAAEEFTRLGVPSLRQVPLGVELDRFSPARRSARCREHLAGGADVLLVCATRLSREKQPGLALEAVRRLVADGVSVRLVVAGHGPMRADLEAAAAGLPVTFLGHVSDRDTLAATLASADVALAPGPVETFGLAALEALAAGTPVVVNAASALPQVVGDAGRAAAGTGDAFAAAVRGLLARPEEDRRAAARARAERYPWSAAVEGFLDVHRLAAQPPGAAPLAAVAPDAPVPPAAATRRRGRLASAA